MQWARKDQRPPEGAWTTWLMLGGRGAGKTRAGAEWVRGMALGRRPFAEEPAGRIALVGQTLQDVREVMVEGVSGLMRVHPWYERPRHEVSRRRLVWSNGTVAELFSAEEPDSLRGPQFAAAWADEIAKWRYPQRTWDMLQFALRIGNQPRQTVTTTPRPIPLIKALIESPATRLSRATTAMNANNLAPGFLDTVVAAYAGTRLGRQELDAEILDDRPDALWSRAMIEAARAAKTPQLVRVVVAVDPPAASSQGADACGIVAAGLGVDGLAYVLADETAAGLKPTAWARRAIALYQRLAADRLVVEVNQGGEMAEAVLRQVEPSLAISAVRASRGKWTRAEPVAALYEQGRAAHAGSFPELEDEMCDFATDGLSSGRSPDRVDALVWALTALMLTPRSARPRVRVV
ncbi:MAG: terminase family protein [Hyphomicrobiales bacterium]|nr:terminase family protein [Hyphomicrobiales bacterium]